MSEIEQRITADGVAVRVGDIAYRDVGWGKIKPTKLTKHDIGWWKHFADEWFSSEMACVARAIETSQRKAKRAATDLKRERARVVKLKARLREIGAKR